MDLQHRHHIVNCRSTEQRAQPIDKVPINGTTTQWRNEKLSLLFFRLIMVIFRFWHSDPTYRIHLRVVITWRPGIGWSSITPLISHIRHLRMKRQFNFALCAPFMYKFLFFCYRDSDDKKCDDLRLICGFGFVISNIDIETDETNIISHLHQYLAKSVSLTYLDWKS